VVQEERRLQYETGLDNARSQHKNELAERQSHYEIEQAKLRSGYDNQLSEQRRMTGGLRRIINRLKGVKTQAPSRHIEAAAAPPRLEFKPED